MHATKSILHPDGAQSPGNAPPRCDWLDVVRIDHVYAWNMPSIPVDVLYHILEHVDIASLIEICLVNKVCCSCSQDILYRDIQIDGPYSDITRKTCQPLNHSPTL